MTRQEIIAYNRELTKRWGGRLPKRSDDVLEEYADKLLNELNSEKMIYTEQLHLPAHELQQIGEEIFYKQMIQSMIANIPMYKLKEIFPLEINEQRQGYSLRIQVEL